MNEHRQMRGTGSLPAIVLFLRRLAGRDLVAVKREHLPET